MNPPDSLHGRWQMLRAELSGEAAPPPVAERTTLEFTAGRYSVRFAGEVHDCGAFFATTTPEFNTLVLHGESGPNAGRTLACIYQLVGDRLRICYGLDGVAPTSFTTSANSRRYLATYRRL